MTTFSKRRLLDIKYDRVWRITSLKLPNSSLITKGVWQSSHDLMFFVISHLTRQASCTDARLPLQAHGFFSMW